MLWNHTSTTLLSKDRNRFKYLSFEIPSAPIQAWFSVVSIGASLLIAWQMDRHATPQWILSNNSDLSGIEISAAIVSFPGLLVPLLLQVMRSGSPEIIYKSLAREIAIKHTFAAPTFLFSLGVLLGYLFGSMSFIETHAYYNNTLLLLSAMAGGLTILFLTQMIRYYVTSPEKLNATCRNKVVESLKEEAKLLEKQNEQQLIIDKHVRQHAAPFDRHFARSVRVAFIETVGYVIDIDTDALTKLIDTIHDEIHPSLPSGFVCQIRPSFRLRERVNYRHGLNAAIFAESEDQIDQEIDKRLSAILGRRYTQWSRELSECIMTQ